MYSCSSFDGIGVVETQMTASTKLLGNAKIQADRFGVADMQIAVRFGREARNNTFDATRIEVGFNDVANEVAPGFSSDPLRLLPCRLSPCFLEFANDLLRAPGGLCHDGTPGSMSIALTHLTGTVIHGPR